MRAPADWRAWSLVLVAVVFLALGAPAGLSAAEHGRGAHAHGVSRLIFAVEAKRAEMELETPGADIVGFEHAPRTGDQEAAVARAVASLKAGDMLFALPVGAKCRLDSTDVEPPKPDKGHAEFRVRYEFHCERPGRLNQIDAKKFFERFPAAREIEAQVVTPKGQRAGELTPAAPKLRF